ncbi:DUF1415 domain-containing protein [Salinicola rhizosphaerae]|uniref:DUF1415 domain-containing protein n=1 Tax=Salinicola rhizosphaerae TaxID=1443141 RepID=A0ABQ3E3S3_9GAMM|nr:DUF1415 domain-containing protein [Salinicola rhizosphaerae]GHB23866.1 DUF1415 domain-containing protein [Salinicola rhizosphaerae]
MQTWLQTFVVGHDICPFAGREFRRRAIRYAVSAGDAMEAMLEALVAECQRLDSTPEIETTLLIFPRGLEDFDDYLELLSLAEALLDSLGYEGIYQLASFHPDYVFDGAERDDPANFTNRAPFPTLHLLREASLERALRHHDDPEGIPARNIDLLREPDSPALSLARRILDARG